MSCLQQPSGCGAGSIAVGRPVDGRSLHLVRELSERVDTSIKFLSDMFSARLYRLAAAKVGVDDYRRLVESKLHAAGELYEFMMSQFHEGRAFVMEVVVIVILIIDLVFLFRGKG